MRAVQSRNGVTLASKPWKQKRPCNQSIHQPSKSPRRGNRLGLCGVLEAVMIKMLIVGQRPPKRIAACEAKSDVAHFPQHHCSGPEQNSSSWTRGGAVHGSPSGFSIPSYRHRRRWVTSWEVLSVWGRTSGRGWRKRSRFMQG